MGAQRNMEKGWKIARDKITGEVFYYQHPTGMRWSEYDNSTAARARYQIIAEMDREEDAAMFLKYLKLGIETDAIHFLQIEHYITSAYFNKASIPDESLSELDPQIQKFQMETGRACFGQCGSIDGKRSCKECYNDLPTTWLMCAQITCVNSILTKVGEDEHHNIDS